MLTLRILPNRYEITTALYSSVVHSGFQSLGRNITPLSFNNNYTFSIKFSDCSFLPDSLNVVECCPKQAKQSTCINFSGGSYLSFCAYTRCHLLITCENGTHL